MATASFFDRHGNTYIYVPNLIGEPPCSTVSTHRSALLRSTLTPSDQPTRLTVPVARCAGYARVVCALFAFAVAMRNPYWCITSYFVG